MGWVGVCIFRAGRWMGKGLYMFEECGGIVVFCLSVSWDMLRHDGTEFNGRAALFIFYRKDLKASDLSP